MLHGSEGCSAVVSLISYNKTEHEVVQPRVYCWKCSQSQPCKIAIKFSRRLNVSVSHRFGSVSQPLTLKTLNN